MHSVAMLNWRSSWVKLCLLARAVEHGSGSQCSINQVSNGSRGSIHFSTKVNLISAWSPRSRDRGCSDCTGSQLRCLQVAPPGRDSSRDERLKGLLFRTPDDNRLDSR